MDLTSYRESSKKVAEFLTKVPPALLDSGTLVRVPAGQDPLLMPHDSDPDLPIGYRNLKRRQGLS